MTNKDGHCIILRCFVHIGNPCLSTSRPAGRMAGSITTGLPQLRQCMIASGDLRTRDQQLRISPLSLMSQLHGRWSSSRAYSQFMGTGGISHWNLGPWGGKSAANSLHGFFKLPLHYLSTAWRRWHHPHRPILTLAFWRHCCCSSAIISTPVNIFMNLKTFSSTSTVLAKMFDNHKTRMIGLPCGEETMTISRFHRIGLPERNGQTDGQTDRIAISISVCWRAIQTVIIRKPPLVKA